MSEDIRDAVQILRVAFDGISFALKVGAGGSKALFNLATFITGMLRHEKLMGKTAMKQLIKRGGDLQVLRFKTEDMKKVAKFAKKYGILYSVVPDTGRNNGMSEIVFHSEAVPRVNMLLQKITSGKILSVDDYLKDNEHKTGKVLDYFNKEACKDASDIEFSSGAKIHNFEEVAERMKAASFSKKTGFTDVTMSKSLIIDEDNLSVKVRIPGTWGSKERHIWIDRANIIDVHKGKTMLTYFENDKKYDIFDKKGKVVNTITGNQLLKNYDEVNKSLRKKTGMPSQTIVPGTVKDVARTRRG